MILCWIQLLLTETVAWTDKANSYLVPVPKHLCHGGLPRRLGNSHDNPALYEFVVWWLNEHRAAGHPVPESWGLTHVFRASMSLWGTDVDEPSAAMIGIPPGTYLYM